MQAVVRAIRSKARARASPDRAPPSAPTPALSHLYDDSTTDQRLESPGQPFVHGVASRNGHSGWGGRGHRRDREAPYTIALLQAAPQADARRCRNSVIECLWPSTMALLISGAEAEVYSVPGASARAGRLLGPSLVPGHCCPLCGIFTTRTPRQYCGGRQCAPMRRGEAFLLGRGRGPRKS